MIAVRLQNEKLLAYSETVEDEQILVTFPFRETVYDERGAFLGYSMSPKEMGRFVEKNCSLKFLDKESDDLCVDFEQKFASIDELGSDMDLLSYGNFKPEDGRQLYIHQKNYCAIPAFKRALLCSFVQGLGKTVSALIRSRVIGAKNVLVICPARVMDTWKSEFGAALGIAPILYRGTPKQRIKLREQIAGNPFVVTNFEQVADLEKLEYDWDHVIIDEIHCLSNPKTAIYKAAYKLLRRCDPVRQGLSGTPMRLYIKDLWGVLNLLDPDFAGDLYSFCQEFEDQLTFRTARKKDHNGIWRLKKVPIKLGTKNEAKLREKLRGIMVRVKRDNITSFKDSVELITVPLTNRQRQLYDDIKANILRDLSTGVLKGGNNVLVRMLRLLQASEGAFNIEPEYNESAKLEWVTEELNSVGNDKCIVWSRFVPITYRLLDRFRDRAVIYNGEVSQGLRTLAVYAFQGVSNEQEKEHFYKLRKNYPDFECEPGEAQFFFGTVHLRSGLGINLHSNCSNCIFTSFDWNPNANFQAKDRISRIGQSADEVFTKFLVSEETLEPRALSSILRNYQHSLDALDGRGAVGYKQVSELIGLLSET